MSQPFIGEVRFISFNYPPKGWAFCNGQILPISQNQALFSILGTNFGGNGVSTFGLPNLQGRTPMHGTGGGVGVGTNGGEANHTLTVNEMPHHNHPVKASSSPADTALPATHVLGATSDAFKIYSTTASSATPLRAGTIGLAGNSQPHTNMQPYLAVSAVVALTGIYPSRN